MKKPTLHASANLVDPVSLETIAEENAYYLQPNVSKDGKIHHVYSGKTIASLLKTSRRSPITRKDIRKMDVRKLTTHTVPPPRRNQPFNDVLVAHLVEIAKTMTAPDEGMKIMLGPSHEEIVIHKEGANKYNIVAMHPLNVVKAGVSGGKLGATLMDYISLTYPRSIKYCGYKIV